MNEERNHILSQCIDDLSKKVDVDAVLRRYPQEAEELRPLLNLAQRSTSHYTEVPEPPNGLNAGRARVLKFAAEQRDRQSKRGTVPAREKRRRPFQLSSLWKLAGAIVAMLLMLVPFSGSIAWASGTSVPGQVLYPLKQINENLHLSNVDAPEVRVTLALAFTDERLTELQTLVDHHKGVPDFFTYQFDNLTYQALQSAAWAAEPIMPTLLNYIMWNNQVTIQKLSQLKKQVGYPASETIDTIQRICIQRYLTAQAGLSDPEAFRAAYQQGRPEAFTLPTGGLLGMNLPAREGPLGDTIIIPEEVFTPRAMFEGMPNGLEPTETSQEEAPEEAPALSTTDVPTATPSPTSTLSPTATATVTPTATATATPLPTPTAAPTQPPAEEPDNTNPGGHPEVPPGLEDNEDPPPGQENRPPSSPGQDKDKDKKKP